MNPSTTLLVAQFTLISGLAVWLCVIVVNNLIAFRNGAFSVGMMMRMALFDDEPKIATPLLSRRVTNAAWHRTIYAFIVALELVTALLLIWAAFSLGSAAFGGDASTATAWATLSLTALLVTTLTMLVGGAWFAYYIRQEGAQITHFALIGVALVSLVLVNLR